MPKSIKKHRICRQHRVSGPFLQAAALLKCENLRRASRFRPILACQKVSKNAELVDSIVFQACFSSIKNASVADRIMFQALSDWQQT